jgi:hypothetical protein
MPAQQITVPVVIKNGSGTTLATTAILGTEFPTIWVITKVRYITSQIEFDVTNQTYIIIVRPE